MNLKEAFRFQNRLEYLIEKAENILDDEDCVIVVYFCTTSWAVFIFRAVREAAFSLAFRAKIRAAAFAVENLAEIFPAAARAAVIILCHGSQPLSSDVVILP